MYLLFDIGGTHMRLATSKDGKRLSHISIFPTPKKFEAGMAIFKTFARDAIRSGAKFTAVCGGVPGQLNKNHTALVRAPNLTGWVGKPIKKTLAHMFRAPVYLENDAALAALGEALRGAGKGHRIVTYLTVGTGVGGARIINGKIETKASGLEPGHQVIVPKGFRCSCGKRGHLEAYVSGSAFERKYHKRPERVTDARAWKEAAQILATGAYNTSRGWPPDVLVLGGSMITGKPAIPLARVRQEVKRLFAKSPSAPPIRKAALGDYGGLYGALAHLKS